MNLSIYENPKIPTFLLRSILFATQITGQNSHVFRNSLNHLFKLEYVILRETSKTCRMNCEKSQPTTRDAIETHKNAAIGLEIV